LSIGTAGTNTLRVRSDGSTLLATAYSLLNAALTNSNVKGTSLASAVQVTTIVPPLLTFVGVPRVRAEAKGAARTRRLINLVYILNGVEKEC